MMRVSQRSRYALRALFELAKRHGQGPVRTADIAEAQAIPPRFLEGILNQLRQVGFVQSVRGNQGGYLLNREPGELTVGELMRFVEGPLEPTGCVSGDPDEGCPLYGDCVFLPMWKRAGEALAGVYDSVTFQDLIEMERQRRNVRAVDYSI
jgi:Rrf2 family transcriptional regulator, cysteine metabolism repressor